MICGFSIFGLSKNVLNHKGIIVWGFFLGGGEILAQTFWKNVDNRHKHADNTKCLFEAGIFS